MDSVDYRQLPRTYRVWLSRTAWRLRDALTPALRDKTVCKDVGAPARSGTFGWAVSLARLRGRGGRQFQLWLDYYANIGRPTLCLCFRSPNRAQVKAASSFARPIRSFSTRDLARLAGPNYILRTPLRHSDFSRPILENYPDENYLSVYFFDRILPQYALSAKLEKRLSDRLVQLVRSAASSVESVSTSAFQRPENRSKVSIHLRRERSRVLAQKAKERDGFLCRVCGFHFAEGYGEMGRGFAEAHHMVWLSKLRGETKSTPDDLVTVCANCHRMLHLMTGKPSDVETLRRIVLRRRASR
ncbi:MAG: HNH endonuclease [Dehalococcoidia bacterium]